MTNRKILYGYKIQNGEIAVQEQEAIIVRRITTLYIGGLSYQKIADVLNNESIPFSKEVPLWNRHKVKRLLENPRCAGANEYPSIIENDVFQEVQQNIRLKTAGCVKREKRPVLSMKDYLRCGCEGRLHRVAGTCRRKDTLYLKCAACGKQFAIPDHALLTEAARQMAEHDLSAGESYSPSSEVIRLTNAIITPVCKGRNYGDSTSNRAILRYSGISLR